MRRSLLFIANIYFFIASEVRENASTSCFAALSRSETNNKTPFQSVLMSAGSCQNRNKTKQRGRGGGKYMKYQISYHIHVKSTAESSHLGYLALEIFQIETSKPPFDYSQTSAHSRSMLGTHMGGAGWGGWGFHEIRPDQIIMRLIWMPEAGRVPSGCWMWKCWTFLKLPGQHLGWHMLRRLPGFGDEIGGVRQEGEERRTTFCTQAPFLGLIEVVLKRVLSYLNVARGAETK